MPAEKSRNKIYVVLVICAGLVVSIWLAQRAPQTKTLEIKNSGVVSVNSYQNQPINDDWKKILVAVDTKNEKVSALLNNNSEVFDETSLTAQMSRDLLSRYLVEAKEKGSIGVDSVSKIVEDTLSLSDYTKNSTVVYISSNLNVNPSSSSEVTQKYYLSLNKMLENRLMKKKVDPLIMLQDAVTQDNPNELTKIDPLISTAKGIVGDLLKMEIPKDAVSVHLALLNSYSELLSNLEAMRNMFTDPVKGLSGITLYDQSVETYKIAMVNVGKYLENKLGPLR